MIKYENQCCDCAVPGYPCEGSSCPYLSVPVYYCDTCNNDTYAEYEVEGEHYCREHAKEYLKDAFEDLALLEQAKTLNILLRSLEE